MTRGAVLRDACHEAKARLARRRWLEDLELRDVIAAVADDLWAHFGPEERQACDDLERYPPS